MTLLSISDELAKTYDLTRRVSGETIFFVAFSGILILLAIIVAIFITKRKTDFKLFPVVYGITAYFIFYVFLGGFVNSYIMAMGTTVTNGFSRFVIQILAVILTNGFLICGRFFVMWFINKYYGGYGNAYGVGLGCGLTEALMNGITILFNYSLCLAINAQGLAAFVDSFETIEEATIQLQSVEVLFGTPSYEFVISSLECIIFLAFHIFISVLFYAVFTRDIRPVNVCIILGLYSLMALPSTMYNSGFLFNSIGCIIAEIAIIAFTIVLCLRVHFTYYKNVKMRYETKDRKSVV